MEGHIASVCTRCYKTGKCEMVLGKIVCIDMEACMRRRVPLMQPMPNPAARARSVSSASATWW